MNLEFNTGNVTAQIQAENNQPLTTKCY